MDLQELKKTEPQLYMCVYARVCVYVCQNVDKSMPLVIVNMLKISFLMNWHSIKIK